MERIEHIKLWDKLKNAGIVRARFIPDEFATFDDLCGDTYNPKANPDISADQLAKEKRAFRSLVAREGVFGYVSEYWNGDAWMHADSVWGFVGEDAHGYAQDIESGAIAAARDFYKSAPGKLFAARFMEALAEISK